MSSLALTLERWSLHQLTLARFREFAREKEAIFWTFVFPLLMAVGLGIAFRNKGPDKVYVGVVTGTPQAVAIGSALAGQPDVVVRQLPATRVDAALRRGDVALVVIPGSAGASYRFDPTRAESREAQLVANEALGRVAGRPPAQPARLEKVTQRGSRYIDFLIPGLLGMNIMSGAMWGVGYALVEMRVRKLLKRLVATPMRRSHFMFAMMASRMVFVFLEMLVLLVFGWLVFGMVVRGSILVIVFMSILGSFAFSGLGLLVASRPRKTESVTGWMNLIMLPMFVFSGVFFSSERFPAAAQPFIKVLPLTALNDGLRATILEGTGLLAQPGRVLLLLVWGAISFVVAMRIFRWS